MYFLCYDRVAKKTTTKPDRPPKGDFIMKLKETLKRLVLGTLLVAVLGTVSIPLALAEKKTASGETMQLDCADSVCVASEMTGEDEDSYAEFIKKMEGLTEEERATLLDSLAKIRELDAEIDELEMQKNKGGDAKKLNKQIDALDAQIVTILNSNKELWEKVDAAYDKEAEKEEDQPWKRKDFSLSEEKKEEPEQKQNAVVRFFKTVWMKIKGLFSSKK